MSGADAGERGGAGRGNRGARAQWRCWRTTSRGVAAQSEVASKGTGPRHFTRRFDTTSDILAHVSVPSNEGAWVENGKGDSSSSSRQGSETRRQGGQNWRQGGVNRPQGGDSWRHGGRAWWRDKSNLADRFRESAQVDAQDDSRWIESLSNLDCIQVMEAFQKEDFNARFVEAMKAEELSESRIFHVVKVLGKLCEVEYQALVVKLLQRVCCKEFIDKVVLFIVEFDERREFHGDVEGFFASLCSFFYGMLRLMPTLACERLRVLIKQTLLLASSLKSDGKVIDQLSFISKKLDAELEKREANPVKVKVSAAEEALQYATPPNNFRDLNVLPTLEDLDFSQEPFLRPNIVEGPFQDVEHYLDVHFRLLKEDSVRPLREGIYEYQQKRKEGVWRRIKVNNLRVFPEVFFSEIHVDNDTIGLMLCFDPKKKMCERIDWASSKRFMVGSLLLLTNDNFVASLLLATVAKRNEVDLKNGRLLVDIQSQDFQAVLTGSFFMVESQVFFGSYTPVLQALQNFDDLSFPLKEYIVGGKSEPAIPNYLLNKSNPVLTLKLLTGEQDVSPLDMGMWPSKEFLGLDASQHTAFLKALTSSVMLIQGPPGTGKTFLALKVAETLLTEDNQRLWRPAVDRRPMLVVCYTNHALDQFLMGLLNVLPQESISMVRVGSSSKEERLQPYTLRELQRNNSFEYRQLARDCRHAFLSLKTTIEHITKAASHLENSLGLIHILVPASLGLVSLDHSDTFMNSVHQYISWLVGYNLGTQARCKWPFDVCVDQFSNLLQLDQDHYSFSDVLNRHGEATLSDMRNWPSLMFFARMTSALKEFTRELEDLEKMIAEKGHFRPKLEESFAQHELLEQEGAYFFDDVPEYLRHPKFAQEEMHPQAKVRAWDRRAAYLRVVIPQLRVMFNLQGRIQHAMTQPWDPELLERAKKMRSLWQLSPQERIKLYCHWVRETVGALKTRCGEFQRDCVSAAQRLRESRMVEELALLKGCSVIGMTTTHAAKHQQLLRHIKPRVVLVEEAAEVLESHVVVSLAGEVEHLILIGDHQQLRPNPACHLLARKYHLDVSLFERLVNNKVECVTLSTQHRMRPEVAALICPTIYPNLINHDSVHQYPSIRGLAKNVFFVDHREPEELVEDIQSYRNVHEACMVSGLVQHLLAQAYEPSTITVLCTYAGQLFLMKSLSRTAKHSHLSDVRIAVVDNFQGEENNIVILSLVRSSDDNEVGFLKIANRVCVALSRAKHGMYIIGNMASLTAKGDIWPKIKEQLVKQDSLGEALYLKCEVHSTVSSVRCEEDFAKLSPNGGCLEVCGVLLGCGHTCTSLCHVKDRAHEDTERRRCVQPCQRALCELNHPCSKQCYEPCGPCHVPKRELLPCGHFGDMSCHVDPANFKCQEEAMLTLPLCGHEREIQCWKTKEANLQCLVKCDVRLSCGHACEQLCHVMQNPSHEEYKCRKPCAELYEGCSMAHLCEKLCFEECGLCPVRVSKVLECGHERVVQCHQEPRRERCGQRCERVNPCGHPCSKGCKDSCEPCEYQVEKELPCGHRLRIACGVDDAAVVCSEPCERALPCGHPCTEICSVPCLASCEHPVQYAKTPACGHSITVQCHEQGLKPDSPRLLERCIAACKAELSCGHECGGDCKLCWQGRLHVPCLAKCGRTLVCGHKCESRCSAPCPPCAQPCELRCPHGLCDQDCGVNCAFCKKKCRRSCPHHACSRRCGEMCSFERCDEPCTKKVPGDCRHDCLGFCGEPCVCECRITEEAFLSKETQAAAAASGATGARFVLLPDCGHVFEATGLHKRLLHQDAHLVKPLLCPLCSMRIQRCSRYTNNIKTTSTQIEIVKRAFLERRDQYLLRIKAEITQNLLRMNDSDKDTRDLISKLHGRLTSLLKKLTPDDRTRGCWRDENAYSVADLHVRPLLGYAQLLRTVVNVSRTSSLQPQRDEALKLIGKIVAALRVRPLTSLSEQEADDWNRELRRLQGLLMLTDLESNAKFKCMEPLLAGKDLEAYTEVCAQLRAPLKYCDKEHHVEVVKKLKALATECGAILEVRTLLGEKSVLTAAVGFAVGSWQWCRKMLTNKHAYMRTSQGPSAISANVCPEM